MPKREDIKTIMIIGSGPIIIGQACEFDYSGTQACKALRSLGYKIILVNSNPATIMTDPVTADVTYIEPLDVARLTEIIAREKPDALLPNLGGQTGLNLSSQLKEAGVLDKYGVEVIGVKFDAIKRGEDRIEFKNAMDKLGVGMAKSHEALTVAQAVEAAQDLGYPVVIRPAYTMGGVGGGVAYNEEELKITVSRGLQASMIGQVLVEESVLGWEELEVEVVRDSKNQMIAICMIENIDPMGVHTGDSFCSAPMITVSEDVQQRLRQTAFDIVSEIGVIGGTNVQMAYNPETDRIIVIEINPRTSRSSALASKATGFPIAYVSALLAAGFTLDEIPYWKEGTMDKYRPYGDYIVLKFARWAFEKFPGAQDKLGTQMKAVGEVMSIGRTYKEALQKAIRGLENGRSGLGFAKNFNSLSREELLQKISYPTSERHFIIYELLRKGVTADEIFKITKIKKYFLEQMKELVDLEEKILTYKKRVLPDELFTQAKKDGFADKYLSMLLEVPEEYIRMHRRALKIKEEWDIVPVSGADAEYYYSTYNGISKLGDELKASREKRGVKAGIKTGLNKTSRGKVVILGGGPNRIGQGIEFDYCCVHTAFALRELGYETIMINCNPETVSTDYDTSDKLYFEPLTVEEVLSICEHEKPLGAIVQFGGQTPLNIAMELKNAGVTILGTSPEVIAMTEDRDLFRKIMEKMNIPMSRSAMARNYEEAVGAANAIGYPVMVRPSYVLGGRAMEVVFDNDQLKNYIIVNSQYISNESPILIDRFLDNALECEADALADGSNAFVPAIMEHIEQAGIHSGDSACVIPTVNISQEQIKTINDYSCKIASELGVVGLLNVQYAIHQGKVYVLEANPRASRTVPIVSKVCNFNMPNIAAKLVVGEKIDLKSMRKPEVPYYGVKECVLPFNSFPEVDPVLGPEMRSTGEALGLSDSFGLAFYKALEAAKNMLPCSGSVLFSIAGENKEQVTEVAKRFEAIGFKIFATRGTHKHLSDRGIKAEVINKLSEGRPNIEDAIKNKSLDIIINTPKSNKSSSHDGSYIRKSAIRYGIPYLTTLTAALAAIKGIEEKINIKSESVYSLQEYHKKMCNKK